jgi:hypothetical protein
MDTGQSESTFVLLDGREMYRIVRCDEMPPFLMSIVSDSDHWMFVSSRGSLTAGRVSEDFSLFPYETDDKIHKAAGATGPLTVLRIRRGGGRAVVWEPFQAGCQPGPGVRRDLYKSVLGNRVVFEETHAELGLTFRYAWATSEEFGFVRTATLEACGAAGEAAEVEVIDGLVNLLPAGADLLVQQRFSCLLDAYTRCEVDQATALGVIALSSLIVDRPEPAESLRATVAWCRGMEPFQVLLSTDQLPAFRAGRDITGEGELKGRRGAYLAAGRFRLEPGASRSWDIVADVNVSQARAERLRAMLAGGADPAELLRRGVAAGDEALLRNVAAADGLHASADRPASVHHLANVLFNNMRGGVFAHNHDVPAADLAAFIRHRNAGVYDAQADFLAALPAQVPVDKLIRDASARGDADLLRLCYEYLPLTFSRRHGDPSRPWNRFAIRVKDEHGRAVLYYQGNWRDIFQNWEALCLSFPQFLPSVIAKFVNASTADGFNPYRVTTDGIDWEAPAPEDPWAGIGYWGDHQIVYLLKFLEACRRYHPGLLQELLVRQAFSYADVPYRIRPYDEVLANPHETITFDRQRQAQVEGRVRRIGADGKLLPEVAGDDAAAGAVYPVSLAEKLLVPILAKLSNLVVDGGIWMNTQRPEWNDANNALVGNGLSMVTLCYLRRHLRLCLDLFQDAADRQVPISAEVCQWLDRAAAVLREHAAVLERPIICDHTRKAVLDGLGRAFSDYRGEVYAHGFSGRQVRRLGDLAELLRQALPYLDHSIQASRRPDGLYHAYNLLELSADGKRAAIGRLYEMLEGQVAVLSSGLLGAEQALGVITALLDSAMYRPDQRSFTLYPDRRLSGFFQKNVIPPQRVTANPLLAALLLAGDRTVVEEDVAGHFRFNAAFRNARFLRAALDRLAADARLAALVAAHASDVLALYELVFRHRQFTGRSGTMYGYEGLGCIYWHMVAKLLVAVQECYFRAEAAGEDPPVVDALGRAYYRIREGLGFNKDARTYGAFPTDPYSHTPAHGGARQPGMTGQVKEEILTRWGELGVRVEGGAVAFRPTLLRRREFLQAPREWTCYDSQGRPEQVPLPAESLAFTFCQVPVVYRLTDGAAGQVTVLHASGRREDLPGDALPPHASQAVLARGGQIARIEVVIPRAEIRME